MYVFQLTEMARTERRTYYAGMVVVMMAVVIRGVSAKFGSTTSTTPSVTLNSTQTTGRDTEIVVRPTTPRSPQTPCVLVALERFQQKLIHDMLYVQKLNLIEYRLVFPNNSINPLTHNMKNIFKVNCPCSIYHCVPKKVVHQTQGDNFVSY